ncbi:MAG TPA: DALR domain-containing protein, partial [Bacteroidales bacterium]|nr:DALR domain-containing protein [Bacteroidales bacterium]
AAMNDDLNSPILIAHLFDGVRYINSVKDGHATISTEDLTLLKDTFNIFMDQVLGLKDESSSENDSELIGGLVNMLLEMRTDAKKRKDFAASDQIRNELLKLGIEVKDRKDGTDWSRK